MVAALFLTGCQEKDDLPPVITLKGQDTLFHVLNQVYNDPGVTAIDDTDGDVTAKVYIDNQVDENRVGEYSVTFHVVDEGGNESIPVSRVVYVYNTGIEYYGGYMASENEVFPGQSTCSYPSYIWIDSVINNRIVFFDFACNSNREVYADISDTTIIIPFQLIQDTIVNMSLQGSGYINDSTVYLEYTKMDSQQTSYWNVYFKRIN